MQIHELKVKAKKSRKRIGRGGKRGTYSGKGNKGQKARSGGNVDPLFEGGRSSLVDRLKKVRGFKSIVSKKLVLGLDVLENKFVDGETVNLKTLVAKKVFRESEIKNGVKILGNGEITKKILVDGEILTSDSAKTAIIKAGGKVAGESKRGRERIADKMRNIEKKAEKKIEEKIEKKPKKKTIAKKK
ncbi:MAG: 50S ribosomal protein L15 [Candidatus Moranbacteria bacterium GW2011_GWE2_35_2-]|nr:MAG: 50S ribosomal protein L15 [Candidatus Moranbacteria bacterium GW2011_GWE2_35_2-]KKQ22913.1 MAG: 50S ribosomal protein L15 [Candidatus Moranbacteria bacterium GW2011_GWF2_37_11]KKQ29271.1 MAG: 50S ribosomal protein L15 [Candidatus Moranbacteria bacterium GW2011_GWD1_37_17]KKQ30856.1 MAG: 50S ribosomal protein L15 [Candidatus Moranbacteria bacterium GW2011_GWE1_37_24]KKQ47293.1 MAG: 50S ribosomal protein L15 [Candidatus Moranbacteria bacterium GW2011_GWD2_37_9]HBO16948.1 50S ribosomal pr